MTLCQTLKVFYQAEYNKEKTASELNVDRHTLRRRLSRVGTLIRRRPLESHHGEMEAALKLAELRDLSPLAGSPAIAKTRKAPA